MQNGETVIDFQFVHAMDFQEGVAAVMLPNKWDPRAYGIAVYIAHNGKHVFEKNRCGTVYGFSEGLAVIISEGRMVYIINRNGDVQQILEHGNPVEPNTTSGNH